MLSVPRSEYRVRWTSANRCLSLFALAIAIPGAAAAQGIRYTLVPSAEYVRWDDGLGLEDGYLYGGRVSFDFGPAVSFQPFFFTRSNLRADPTEIDDETLASFPARELDVRHLGANVQLNLGSRSVVPFLRAGGGVLRLSPEGGDRADQISLLAGGGVRFDLGGRVGAEFFAEDLAFRVERGRLYASSADAPLDPEADELRHNLVLGAGVTVPLGGGYSDVSTLSGLRGAAIPLEPFVGRLSFDDAAGLDDQNLLGVRTGVDFNQYFGLRGFYWRGVTDDFDGTSAVQSYGGEAQFNLNSGPGVSPYVIAGAGRLDFSGDFRDTLDLPRADRTALILGGGVSLGLSERLRLNVAARDYIFDRDAEFEDVRNTDNLLHNLLLSAGLTFSLGGRTPAARDLPSPEIERLRQETERLRAENERLREGREDEPRIVVGENEVLLDTVFVNERGERIRRVERRSLRDVNVSDRTVEIPVPANGEIYLRYGEPDAERRGRERAGDRGEADLSAGEIREIIREEVRREPLTTRSGERLSERDLEELEDRLAAGMERSLDLRLHRERTIAPVIVPERRDVAEADAATLDARLDGIERRLEARMDALVQQRVREELRRRPAASGPGAGTGQRVIREWILPAGDTLGGYAGDTTIVTDTVAPAGDSYLTAVGESPAVAPTVAQPAPAFLGLRGLEPYVGASLEPAQALVGLRLNAGALSPGIPVSLVPEAALGFGDGDPSLLIAANLHYSLGALFPAFGMSPYILGGAGILNAESTRGVVNLGAGVAADVSRSPLGRTVGFLEYQGVDLFDQHRVLLGLRLGF